ncbi:hypothetical protein RHMOL_Rhmol01G0322100 [Rhododendron molle]|uniref:Uncharacterized protein n=1 Tax=Rhododendron molle TaxID=49168 RepID=A0ACC0QBB3_RHOML|nr:hypothetical protein RHMOL_Rhmol01G0322100 [Rhododendron molle]
MGIGLRLWLCLLLSSAVICYARNTISFSGREITMVWKTTEGRSLQLSLDDYSEGPEASANNGHDPKFGGGSNGGNRRRDNP